MSKPSANPSGINNTKNATNLPCGSSVAGSQPQRWQQTPSPKLAITIIDTAAAGPKLNPTVEKHQQAEEEPSWETGDRTEVSVASEKKDVGKKIQLKKREKRAQEGRNVEEGGRASLRGS